jgi:hypothetical protein
MWGATGRRGEGRRWTRWISTRRQRAARRRSRPAHIRGHLRRRTHHPRISRRRRHWTNRWTYSRYAAAVPISAAAMAPGQIPLTARAPHPQAPLSETPTDRTGVGAARDRRFPSRRRLTALPWVCRSSCSGRARVGGSPAASAAGSTNTIRPVRQVAARGANQRPAISRTSSRKGTHPLAGSANAARRRIFPRPHPRPASPRIFRRRGRMSAPPVHTLPTPRSTSALPGRMPPAGRRRVAGCRRRDTASRRVSTRSSSRTSPRAARATSGRLPARSLARPLPLARARHAGSRLGSRARAPAGAHCKCWSLPTIALRAAGRSVHSRVDRSRPAVAAHGGGDSQPQPALPLHPHHREPLYLQSGLARGSFGATRWSRVGAAALAQ